MVKRHPHPAARDSQAASSLKASKQKRIWWIAACLMGALAIAGSIAAVVSLQGMRDREFASLAAELAFTRASVDDANSELEAALVLSSVQHTEARGFVQELTALGLTEAPILTEDQARMLADSAVEVAAALGDAPEHADVRADLVEQAQSQLDELELADMGAAEAAEQEQQDAHAEERASFLALSVADMQQIMGERRESEAPDRVSGKADGEGLEQARQDLSAARAELIDIQGAIDEEEMLSSRYVEAVAVALPALVRVAEATPMQAKAVNAAAAEADDAANAVTVAADAAAQAADERSSTAVQVQSKLSAYVAAAKAR